MVDILCAMLLLQAFGQSKNGVGRTHRGRGAWCCARSRRACTLDLRARAAARAWIEVFAVAYGHGGLPQMAPPRGGCPE